MEDKLKTLKAHFFLRDKEAKKTAVLCYVSLGSERVKVSTGISIDPKDWNKTQKNIKNIIVRDELKKIDSEFDKYNQEVKDGKREPDIYDGKGLILLATGQAPETKKDEANLFSTHIQKYYDTFKDGLAWNTAKKYITLKNFIIEKYPKLTIDQVNKEWAEKLRAYCLEKKMLNNTISKRFQLIRVVMKWVNKDFNTSGFTHTQDEKSERVYLTDEDLQKIKDLDLSCRPALEPIRDLFIISSYTGIDFVDLKQIKKEKLKTSPGGNKYLHILRRKTEKKNIYSNPIILPEIEKILNKYKWELPLISYDKTLKHLKDICFMAGFTEPIKFTYNSGGRSISETRPKFDWIGWKSSRRSYITNLYKDENSTVAIMRAVGHVKPTTTEIYNQGKDEEFVDMIKIKVGGEK